jgi:NitT/TauT family transport system substrate-binding protein
MHNIFPSSCFVRLAKLIGASAVLAGMCAVDASAQINLERASVRLEGLSGYHAPFFLALERGYYKDQGIDLSVYDGNGSTLTIQVIASGSDTFGVGSLSGVAIAVGKGVPLVSVAGIIQKNPDAVIALAERNILRPKDIEGKRGAFVPNGSTDRLFPAFAKANNIDLDKISRINISRDNRYSVLLQGNADFVLGWSFTDAYRINRQKPISPPILFSEHGVTMLGAGIFLTRETAAKRPKLIRAFLAATVRGFEDALEDPIAAVDAEVRARPVVDREFMLAGMQSLRNYMRISSTTTLPTLAMTKEDWEKTRNNLVEYLNLSPSTTIDAFYTNEFLPGQ